MFAAGVPLDGPAEGIPCTDKSQPTYRHRVKHQVDGKRAENHGICAFVVPKTVRQQEAKSKMMPRPHDKTNNYVIRCRSSIPLFKRF